MDGPYAFLGITVGTQGIAGPPPVMQAQPLIGPQIPPGILSGPPGNLGPGPLTPAPGLINPATNDAPLEFNTNKNKPPMAIPGKGEEATPAAQPGPREEDRRRRSPERERRDRDRRDRERERERVRERDKKDKPLMENSNSSSPFLENGPQLPLPGMPPPTMDGIQQQWGMMYPVVPMGTDPNMMSMMPMGFNQFGFMGTGEPAMTPMPMMPVMTGPSKEIIHCKSCTLFPPNPNAPPPTTRERPPGCRTVFVGGLPENITEEIIREVFERCGEITTVRMSKKNFCHIRFESEAYIDNAIFLSGYRIRIGSNTDPPNTGRLHVDYAQARDDLYEWECRQRQLQREQRHRERLEQERLRPPSPPPIVHFSDHESQLLAEKLKGDDTFQKAVQILITWLERGDCSKRNAGQFYSMIQSTNSHVRRLMNEKGQYEEELLKAKEMLNQRMHGILIQFDQIEKVFMAASHQKVWDHFTKAQRKNIDMWKKQAQEIKNAQLEDALNERIEYEMEVSDEEGDKENNSCKKTKLDGECSNEQIMLLNSQLNNIKEENDSLRCQLEAYKNEVDLIKVDSKHDLEEKTKQVKVLQQALQGMQQQLIQANQQRMKDEEQLQTLRRSLKASERTESTEGALLDSSEAKDEILPSVNCLEPQTIVNIIRITEKEARLIGLLSTFLHVHPFGASVDYIWSYLQRLDSQLKHSDVESLLLKFPNLFKQEFSGVGASLERKWNFIGFKNDLSVAI